MPESTLLSSPAHSGFTLIEVLLAMVIIVIGLTAVVGVNVLCLEALRSSEEKVQAVALLEGEIVDLRAQSVLQEGLKAGEWSGEWEGLQSGQWTAQATEENDFTQLSLQGQWSRSGHFHSVSLATKAAAPQPEGS